MELCSRIVLWTVLVIESLLVVFQAKLTSVTIPSPKDGSTAHGLCKTENEYITIAYSNHNNTKLSLTFNFMMDNGSSTVYHINSFSLTAKIDAVTINGWLTISHLSDRIVCCLLLD